VDYYRESELVYIGDRAISLKKILNVIEHECISIFPIYYDKLMDTLIPDPYISGALITYGDYSSEYINLPSKNYMANQVLHNQYFLEYGNKLGENIITYKSIGDPPDQLVTWKEFFPNSEVPCDDIIPLEYRRASMNDRWKFIRGAFDNGYDPNTFPDSCSISNVSEERLESIQKILWSIGVPSVVSYDANLKDQYHLDVKGEACNHPAMFYSIEFVEKMIEDKKTLRCPVCFFKLKIQSIELYADGYSKSLVLDIPRIPYLTSNFLPRVSE
jgi:hypothetical protein